MIISARNVFKEGKAGWAKYIEWVKLPHLKEARTIDASLNKYVGDCGNIHCDSSTISIVLESLPTIDIKTQYYLLAVNTSKDGNDAMSEISKDKNIQLLGYDLADSTYTSSVLNCGSWEDQLMSFKDKINQYGLLGFDDAKAVQAILPQVWGKEEPHAHVDVYAVFQILKSEC